MMQCFHFMLEPAKNLTAKIKESHYRAKKEKREPLDEDQLFIVDLARNLNRVCQKSGVLEHIWNQDDDWPTPLCRAFIVQWASMLESKKRPMQTDGWPEKDDCKQPDVITEQDLLQAKTLLLNWMKDVRAQPEQSVWPGEPMVKVLGDLQSSWRWGRVPNLLAAMELVMWTLMFQQPDKDTIPQQWLLWKQKTQNIGAISYVPQPVWDWITDAAVEVTLDLDTANPDLLITDEKRMRCGFERKDIPNYHQRFDGWWCAVAVESFKSGRHYWEVEVGERDWRLGVAKESALRKGFKSLNTDTGYLTLRLERGTELKALTVPFTALPPGLIPSKVGIYLDYENGQLSFYDVERHFHIYTYNETFNENLFPLFGTVEIIKDLVITSPESKSECLCPSSCLWV
ncbi:butyrophilin subfamily 3 member A1 [Salarias fasciatus]|uniref:Butyrophilin subfamily 3 member A1-like n=1 Tax=Salarias fasciatus TaxID=181472 RepID=A0A672F8L6_SALFA|nr:butyrophilin subfamily 3 member A1-like [Salarias fasciatus]XP_029945379.1 butyrophilin subfamily 3 member A1-like [Salarias fasciatus]